MRSGRIQNIRRATLVICGGVTLGLELVASRLLTPYFGTSLFVWTAILVVTLMALAIGYHRGGLLTRRREDLPRYFVELLLGGGISLLAGRFLAGIALPGLVDVSLVGGAFIGALVLLALPLIYLSALNPALVALERNAGQGGDAGSGGIFALSTLGSVAGAAIAAFLIIPYIDAPDILNVFAAAVSLLAIVNARFVAGDNVRLHLTGGIVLAAAAIMAFVMQPQRTLHFDKADLTLLDRYYPATGQVSVVKLDIRNQPVRLVYFQAGGFESITGSAGDPLSAYTLLVGRARTLLAPHAKRALVLGLAAGSIPKLFADDGVESDVVDVNPDAVRIAQTHFGFDPSRFHVFDMDARVFLQRCDKSHPYDVIVFDVFSGMEPVEHMLTREAFAAAGECLAPGGLIMANTIVEATDSRLAKMVASAMSQGTGAPVWGYPVQPGNHPLGNLLIVSSRSLRDMAPDMPLGEMPKGMMPAELPPVLYPVALDADPRNSIADQRNRASIALAGEEMTLRQAFHVITPLGW